MANPKTLARMTDRKTGKTAAIEDESEHKLDDPAVQERILRPPSTVVKIGGIEHRLHVLSAANSRALRGWATRVFINLDRSKQGKIGALIIAEVSKRSVCPEFCWYLAAATQPAGTHSDDSVDALSKEFDEKLAFDEIEHAWATLLEMNNLFPKAGGSAAPRP